MKIEPARIINDFIEPNKRQYSIPVYQRNYEWSHEQCVKLFQDIINAYKADKPHFCGSVVYAQLKEEHNINYYVIIDGQQRLTTIYLLLKALLDLAEDEKSKNAIASTMLNVDRYEEFNTDIASKLKLKPIKTDNNQLLLLMENKFDKIDRSSDIWHNYELFSTLIRQQLDGGLYTKDIFRGVEKLNCASIRLDSDDNAQEIFERINSTGVPLSLADKIRNFVLMTDVNQEYLYENYWLNIEQSITKEFMTAFFLDYLNFKIDGFTKESEAYDNFKTLYNSGEYSKEDILKEVLHYARFYHAFLFGDSVYGEKVNAILQGLQKTKQTTVFLFLFSLFDDFENKVIGQGELEQVLQFLLNYSIRRIVCEVPSNSLRGLYKTLYSRVFSVEENKTHYYDSLVSFFLQLSTKDAVPDDEKFASALKQNNLYRKFALCKYILTELENQGKEKIDTNNLSIEHIMPQNKNLSTYWQNMLGEDWKTVQDKYLHTLGNLTLTGYNSELGDKPFTEKKKLIEDVSSKVVFLYSDVKDKDVWNMATIEERANHLSSELTKIYKIEQPSRLVSFKDSRYQEYTCENPDNATYKTPEYFVLQGERVKTTSFADMLKAVVDRLYEQDKSIIENMAKNDVKPVSWSSNVLFSYDREKTSSGFRFGNTEIYESVGFSSAHIVYIIKSLLERYDIDEGDFVYSARQNNSSGNESKDDFLMNYWKAFIDYAYGKNELPSKRPYPQGWLCFGVGKRHCSINLLCKIQKQTIGIDFYIRNNKELFHSLLGRKEEIEKAVGCSLGYSEASKDCRFVYEKMVDVKDKSKWPEYFDWYLGMLVRFRVIADQFVGQ